LADNYLKQIRDNQTCAGIAQISSVDKSSVDPFFVKNGLACEINYFGTPNGNPWREVAHATCSLSGKYYDGRFDNNQFLGYEAQNKNQGLRIFRDGSYCRAPLSKGELDGQGECWLVGKQHYKGSFANGKFDGMGILTNDDGSKFQGLFKNDKPVQARGIYKERDSKTNKLLIKEGLPCKQGVDNDCS
jgi:hypothetical protein